MSGHTPGPWVVQNIVWNGGGLIEGPGVFSVEDQSSRTVICSRHVPWPDKAGEMEANARLIAAAPGLLEACLTMIAWDHAENSAEPYVKDNGKAWRERLALCQLSFDQARAAIAAATGQTP